MKKRQLSFRSRYLPLSGCWRMRRMYMAYYTGIRTPEEARQIMQSRLWIYVNE